MIGLLYRAPLFLLTGKAALATTWNLQLPTCEMLLAGLSYPSLLPVILAAMHPLLQLVT